MENICKYYFYYKKNSFLFFN